MTNIIQKIRIAAILAGCALVLFSFISMVTNLAFVLSPPTVYSNPYLFAQIMAMIASFAFHACVSFMLVILACKMDPAKMIPLFDKEPKSDAVPEAADEDSIQG